MSDPLIAERHKPHFHRQAPQKEACRAATTANITIATALNNGDSLDGLTLATGDRVLVKNQGTDSQNGIYVVGVSPARAYDLSTDDPSFGFLVFVREGTANGGKLWKNLQTSAPTVDSTSITFSEFTSGLSDPMTTRGDIIVRDASNVTARLGLGTTGKVLTSDGTDISWATPSGGTGGGTSNAQTPTVLNRAKAKNPAANTFTITAPTNGNRLVLGLNASSAAVTAVATTNVTWTKMTEITDGGGSRLSIWVGVAAASAGTSIAVTTTSTFLSCVVAEVVDALTPTFGSSANKTTTGSIPTWTLPINVTAGTFLAAIGTADNTNNTGSVLLSVPYTGVYDTAEVMMALGYAPSGDVSCTAPYGMANSVAGGLLIVSIT